MLDAKSKAKIIKKFQTHDNDTGSTQVQVAILTEEIKRLANHLKNHKKDHSSRLGLLKKIGERRRLLRYLEREDIAAFTTLVKTLKLKVAKKFDKNKDQFLEDVSLETEEDDSQEEAQEEVQKEEE